MLFTLAFTGVLVNVYESDGRVGESISQARALQAQSGLASTLRDIDPQARSTYRTILVGK
jgi:hypothetical protein